MKNLVETHFHPKLDDELESDLKHARAEGVGAFIAVGADLESSNAVNQLASVTEDLWATTGCHPHAAAEFDGNIEPYRELAQSPKNCAIGEIGLDYYYEYSDRQCQREVFSRFLKLAAELDLPMVVHCREAYEDCIAILERDLEPGQPFEIHSFTGTTAIARKFLAMGAYMSFNGIVTFKQAENVRSALDEIPLERLMLETDAPYLAPVPYRGRRNQPAYLPHIAKFVAARKGIEYQELITLTSSNAKAFFKLLQSSYNAL